MNYLNRFLFDRQDAVMIDGTGIHPDPELVARNAERAREIIQKMGPKWCCWQDRDTDAGRIFHRAKEALRRGIDNRSERREQWALQALHEEQQYAAYSHTER